MFLETCRRFTLDNGLELVCAPMPAVRSVSMGLYVRVGSRYETAAEAGISHFLEHMLFKGCEGWPTARAIANEIEGRGGYLNASTGPEFTSYWVRIGARHWRLGLNVLAAMIRRPLLDPTECERERQVILDEIAMYRDVPEDYVSQLSNEALWDDHPLGREIAGTPEAVAALTVDQLRDYHHRGYRPEAAVLSIAGAVDAEAVLAATREAFGDWEAGEPLPPYLPAPVLNGPPRLRAQQRPAEQSHIQLAVPGLPRRHPDRFVLNVLNAVVGDGLSSRLWQRLREELGLAYSVGSYIQQFDDAGVLGVFGGCDTDRLEEALNETMAVWRQLQTEALDADALQMYKEYLKGRLELSSEDSSAVASWWGRQLIANHEMLSLDQVLAAIDAVTADDVRRLAETLWRPERLTLAYVGPADPDALRAWLFNQSLSPETAPVSTLAAGGDDAPANGAGIPTAT